jgi:hypothetical protein
MRFRTTIAMWFTTSAVAAQAHPGHPALNAEHAHSFFGMDPLYAVVLLAGGAVAFLLRCALQRHAKSKRR